MSKRPHTSDLDPEILAINAVYLALRDLSQDSQSRVIDYVSGKLGLKQSRHTPDAEDESKNGGANDTPIPKANTEVSNKEGGEELEGISPVAQKWMRRNGLASHQLAHTFSLGVDEIDLVAKTVPGGKKKKEKMRSVFLLKGVAAYLGSGVPRFTHEQAKETCLHYDAYDVDHFAQYLKGMASEVSGNKESGYQLSARGLAAATELVKKVADTQSS